jgi:hypothetical protein
VFFGRVQWAKAGSYSLIRTRTANLRVHWVEDIMPPDVYVGHTVCAAGKIKTFEGGRIFTIIDAVPIPEGKAAMRKFMALLDETAADPVSWCPDIWERKRSYRV